MANIIEMPKLSDTMTAGTVVSWLKNEGDVVESGDILAEIETDKATQELETFDDGTILNLSHKKDVLSSFFKKYSEIIIIFCKLRPLIF